MTERTESRSLLAPLLAAMLGAGVALLLAPRSGKETRAKMRMKAEDMKHQAEDGVAEVRESLDRSIREAQDLKERLSAALGRTGEQAKKELKDLRGERDRREERDQSPVLSTWEEEV